MFNWINTLRFDYTDYSLEIWAMISTAFWERRYSEFIVNRNPKALETYLKYKELIKDL